MKKFAYECPPENTTNGRTLSLIARKTKYPGLLITNHYWEAGYSLTHEQTGCKASIAFKTIKKAVLAAMIVGPMIDWTKPGREILKQCAKLPDRKSAQFRNAIGSSNFSSSHWKQGLRKRARGDWRKI